MRSIIETEKISQDLARVLQNTELYCGYIGENGAFIYGKNQDSQIDASDLRDLADAGYTIQYIDITRGKLKISVFFSK